MTSFSDLGLSPEVLQAVADAGYTEPTPIQAQAIPIVLQGRDVLGIAQTGTGKTAGFTLPMIDRLAAGRSKARMPRSLVIEPTRELADQVAAAFEKYAKQHKLTWALLIGGVSFDDQLKKLDRGVDVLIATPGRLLDHFERGKLLLTGVQMMVVDEADRMLDMGFIPDIERIFKMTPAKKQTLFFSATMPPEITRLTKQFLNDPVRIEASAPATTAETISQHIARIPSSDPKAKRMALRALVGAADVRNGIVFCNRKSEVDIVAKSLRTHGFDASPIHGDLDQSMRTRTLEAFRKGDLKLLVASDVAARGLDIPDVSHVFNYDVPHHADDYVHRIGRTGRAGRKGDAYMIVTPADSRSLDKVLKLIGQSPIEEKLDLDWASAKTEERPGRDGARGRSGSRERPDRERGPRRERSEPRVAETVEATAPESAPAEAPSPAPPREQPRRAERHREERPREDRAREDRPREDRPREDRRPEPSERQARPERRDRQPERHERPERQDQSDRHDRSRGDDGPRVVGFGNDVPAFLSRAPAKIDPAAAED
jgi:superfamily II DNA/RNA helicase